jgi:membrane protein DedA with SNARE-associated domain
MTWWRFLFWNAAGGIVWAVAIGLLAFYAGKAAADALARYGVYAAIGGGILLVVGIVVLHVWRRRVVEQNP